MFCPNKNHPDYKRISSIIGESDTFILWNKLKGKINLEKDSYFKSLMFKHKDNEVLAILDWVDQFKFKNTRKSIYKPEYYNKISNNLKSIFAKSGIDVEITNDYFLEASASVQQLSETKFRITVNPVNIREDTLFHEFGHIFVDLLGYENPLIQSAINIAKQSIIYNKISLLYNDKYQNIDAIEREKLINKEVVTTLLSNEVSSLYRDKTFFSRWQSIKRTIFDYIKSLFGIKNENVFEQLATDMLFNPISISDINKDFDYYIQYQLADNKFEKIKTMLDNTSYQIKSKNPKLYQFLNTINSQDYVKELNDKYYKHIQNLFTQNEIDNIESSQYSLYILKTLEKHRDLQALFIDSINKIKSKIPNSINSESIKFEDIGSKEYQQELIENIVYGNELVELIEDSNKDIETYFSNFISEIENNQELNQNEKKEFEKITLNIQKNLNIVNSLKNSFKNRSLDRANNKITNYILEKLSTDPMIKSYFEEGKDVAKLIQTGEIKLEDTTASGKELNALINQPNAISSAIALIFDMNQNANKTESLKAKNKLLKLIDKNKGKIKELVDESGFLVKKVNLGKFWSDYKSIENKKLQKQFLKENIDENIEEFNSNINNIIDKYKKIASEDNEIFTIDDINSTGTRLYFAEFASEIEAVGGKIIEYTNTFSRQIAYTIVPEINQNTKFKNRKYNNEQYEKIENDKNLLEYYNTLNKILTDSGLIAYNTETNDFDAHIPFESINKKAKSKALLNIEIEEKKSKTDLLGFIIDNRDDDFNKMIDSKPFVKKNKDLMNRYKSKNVSVLEKQKIEKQIVEEVNLRRDYFQIPKNVIIETIIDIDNYNKTVEQENRKSHIKGLNFENIEERLLNIIESRFINNKKRDILGKFVFLTQQLNSLNKRGIQITPNVLSHIKMFHNQVYNGNFKNNPNNVANKMADKLQGITSRLGMGFNLHSAIKNLVTGMNQNLIETSIHYSKKDLTKASGKILRLLPTFINDWNKPEGESTTKERAIFLNFPIFESIRAMADTTLEGDLDTKSKAMKYFDNSLFFLQDKTEFFIQHSMYLAMMYSHKIINGKIMSFNDYKMLKLKQMKPNLTNEEIKKIYLQHEDNYEEAKKELKKVKKEIIDYNYKIIKENKDKEKQLLVEFEKYTNVFDSFQYKDGMAEIPKNIINDDELRRFIIKVRSVNQSNQGIYNIEQKSAIERYAIARLAFQFRHWMLPMWDKRFGRIFFKETYDEATQYTQKGMYHSLAEYFGIGLIKQAIKEYALLPETTKLEVSRASMIMEAVKERFRNFRMYNSLMSDVDKSNMKKVQMDMLLLAFFSLSYALFKNIGDDDKEKIKNNFLLQMMIYQTDAISTELASMNPLFGMTNEMSKIVRSPAAVLTTTKNMTSFMYYTLGSPIMSDDKLYFKTGENKDRNKAIIYGMKSTPGLNQLYRIYNMDKNYHFYRLQKKPFQKFWEDFFQPKDFNRL